MLRRVLQHPAGIFSRKGAFVTEEKRLNDGRGLEHQLFKAYAECRCDPSDLAWIEVKRQSDPVFEAFFSAVDSLSAAAGAARLKPDAGTEISQIHEIDDLISLAFSELVTRDDAGRCLNSLILSPLYFEKFRKKITESVQSATEKPAFNTENVSILSDEEMLARIRGASTKSDRKSRYGKIGFWSRLSDRARNLPSAIGSFIRRPVFAAAVILLTAGIVWILAFYKPVGSLPEFAVFKRTVPYPFDQSGLRSFDETISDADEALFIRKLKLGMSDYVKWEFGQATALFESEEPEARQLAQRPSMAVYVREYYFYWAMSRLSVVRLREPFSDNDRRKLGEAARLLTLAVSTTEERGLAGIDRDLFFLGLALGLEGKKIEACSHLKKISGESRFIKDSHTLLGSWLDNSR